MQGSTSRPFPAKIVTSGNPETIARYWQRLEAIRVKRQVDVIKANTPRKLTSTVYDRHQAFVADAQTSHDLRASLTVEECRAVDQFAAMPHDRDTDKMQTFIMPRITSPQAPTSPIRYITYQRADNPLVMLYGAVIAAIRAFKRPPDILFMSASQEAALAGETETVTGKKYDGRFYVVDARAVIGGVKSYPVLTEDELPAELMRDFEGYIEHDTVVAVVER